MKQEVIDMLFAGSLGGLFSGVISLLYFDFLRFSALHLTLTIIAGLTGGYIAIIISTLVKKDEE